MLRMGGWVSEFYNGSVPPCMIEAGYVCQGYGNADQAAGCNCSVDPWCSQSRNKQLGRTKEFKSLTSDHSAPESPASLNRSPLCLHGKNQVI